MKLYQQRTIYSEFYSSLASVSNISYLLVDWSVYVLNSIRTPSSPFSHPPCIYNLKETALTPTINKTSHWACVVKSKFWSTLTYDQNWNGKKKKFLHQLQHFHLCCVTTHFCLTLGHVHMSLQLLCPVSVHKKQTMMFSTNIRELL